LSPIPSPPRTPTILAVNHLLTIQHKLVRCAIAFQAERV
jgi:hypothetical protein